MNEKFSHPNFDSIVGVTSKYNSEELREYIDGDLKDGGEFIKDLELTKTEQDKKIIDFVVNAVNEILSSYGREDIIPIDYDHIHILSQGGVTKLNPDIVEGAHDTHLGAVLVERNQSDFEFARVLFHELVHMKSYKALQVTTEGDLEKYRGGWSAVSRDGSTNYFTELEEGVIDFLTEKFYNEYLSGASFLSDSEVPEYKTYRQEERADLHHVVKVVSEESGLNEDIVLEMFIKAQVTGNFLGLAKIIEKYVGKGKFRELGEMTGNNSY